MVYCACLCSVNSITPVVDMSTGTCVPFNIDSIIIFYMYIVYIANYVSPNLINTYTW